MNKYLIEEKYFTFILHLKIPLSKLCPYYLSTRYLWKHINIHIYPALINHCYLIACGLQHTITSLWAHFFNDPGFQSIPHKANVRQELGKLPFKTRYLLREHTQNRKVIEVCLASPLSWSEISLSPVSPGWRGSSLCSTGSQP